MLNRTLKSCMMYLLRFHYSLRDREPEREAQEGAEKRNSGNCEILCHGNNRFFSGGTRQEIAGSEQIQSQVTVRKTVSEICRFPLPCSVKDRIAIQAARGRMWCKTGIAGTSTVLCKKKEQCKWKQKKNVAVGMGRN